VLSSILMRLVYAAPSLAVYVAGTVLASKRMQRLPGPSRTAMLAFALLIAGWLIPQAAFAVVDYRIANRPEHQTFADLDDQIMWIMSRATLTNAALFLAGIGLLLKAVYADRDGAGREAMPEEEGEQTILRPDEINDCAAPFYADIRTHFQQERGGATGPGAPSQHPEDTP
jgi:hypothetical protein